MGEKSIAELLEIYGNKEKKAAHKKEMRNRLAKMGAVTTPKPKIKKAKPKIVKASKDGRPGGIATSKSIKTKYYPSGGKT